MHRINNIVILLSLLLLASCIKTFDPVISSNEENRYVVSGRVTDAEGWQMVEISKSSPVESPKYLPVSGCTVKIIDNKGHEFSLDEYKAGQYQVWMGAEYLVRGTAFKVNVTTPDGETLASSFDTMQAGPVLDTVYYRIKDIPTTDPAVNSTVMQFYVDLNAEGDYSRYYKWEVLETWEYHAAHPAEFYYDGTFHQIIPPDYSRKVCWITGLVKNVFTVSTGSLAHNTYNQYPLHNIDGKTSRLGILYSMLVTQFALSEGAYNYWEKLRINSNEQGGLYEKQPLAIQGNLVNVNNPGKAVLGYFYAASVSSKRYFYNDVPGIILNFENFCFESGLGRFGWKEYFTWEYPIYYYFSAGVVRILSRPCIDCRLMGGDTIKPGFWPY